MFTPRAIAVLCVIWALCSCNNATQPSNTENLSTSNKDTVDSQELVAPNIIIDSLQDSVSELKKPLWDDRTQDSVAKTGEDNLNTAPAIPKIKQKPRPKPAISFKEITFDFGEIEEGDIIKHNFVFKNKGEAPLQIKSVDVSCGCTFPSYPFLPIEPGDTGYIGVTFNSKGKSGEQNPKLTVKTNVRNQEIELFLKGIVNKVQDSESSEKDSLEIDHKK